MKELLRAVTIFTLATAASGALAQYGPPWRWQGWCEYKWPDNQSPPPRLNLPDWVCEVAHDAKLHTKYLVYSKINPFFITADFNGDRDLDAAVWVIERRTQKRGLAIFHRGNKRPIILAAGTPWEERGDDFRFVDQWSVIPRGQLISSGYEEGGEDVKLEADALLLIKSESASFAVFWNGKEYKSYQQSD
jgi:hypothetical protein